MITTGLTLAVLTATGFYLIYKKLPGSVRNFMQRHILFTDAVACLLTYALFGGTLVALFAAAWVGIITSMMLALVNNPRSRVLMEHMAEKAAAMKDKFVEWVVSFTPEPKENNAVQQETQGHSARPN